MERILLINPNQYRHPPVIPIGLEYLSHALKQSGFEVDVLDLTFKNDVFPVIGQSIAALNPDCVGVTVRNIDSALYKNSEFFLPFIRDIISHVRTLTDAPVIAGGAAFVADPYGIVDFIGADLAISGPAEKTMPLLLRNNLDLIGTARVVRGALPDSACPERMRTVSYGPYIENGGIAGFETHKGCTTHCAYCIEAGTPVRFRDPRDITREIRQLVEGGYDHFHLCDTEFNEDLDFSVAVLDSIVREKLPFRWALYMKPGNFNKRLFSLLAESGAYLVTLTVDTFQKCPEYWEWVEKMVFLGRRAGIRICIDLLTGFPYEGEDVLTETFDFFRRVDPHEVVVNTHIRLYANTRITTLVRRDDSLRKHLRGSTDIDRGLIEPVFYGHVDEERLKELLAGDPLFRIAGEEQVVNYQTAG